MDIGREWRSILRNKMYIGQGKEIARNVLGHNSIYSVSGGRGGGGGRGLGNSPLHDWIVAEGRRVLK
jgi:hypothetical protein